VRIAEINTQVHANGHADRLIIILKPQEVIGKVSSQSLLCGAAAARNLAKCSQSAEERSRNTPGLSPNDCFGGNESEGTGTLNSDDQS